MRHSRSIVPFLVVLVAAACETPVEPRTAVIEASLVAAHQQGVVASATGSGHYTSGGALRTLSFNAVKRADGTTSGNYHVTIHAIQRFFDVNVTCLSVRNDTAWIAGIIEKTNHPVIQEGTVSYFWAVDGGEGSGTSDKVSTARINDVLGQDQAFCSHMPDEAASLLPGNVVEHGDVQVRGG